MEDREGQAPNGRLEDRADCAELESWSLVVVEEEPCGPLDSG